MKYSDALPGGARRACVRALWLLCSCKSLSVYQQFLIPPLASTKRQTDRHGNTSMPRTGMIRHNSSRGSDLLFENVPSQVMSELGVGGLGLLEPGDLNLWVGHILTLLWTPSSLTLFPSFFPWLRNTKSSRTFN